MHRIIGISVAVAVLSIGSLASGEICCDIDSPCSSCLQCTTQGTLFRWCCHPGTTGGPDPDGPLVTDRPDFTEASSTVGLGVAQIEMGYTFVSDDDGTTQLDVHSWGEPLLRYGVFRDWLEFRLALFPLTEKEKTASQSNSTSGLADMYVGFKIGLTPQAGFLPEMAIMPQMFVPIGSSSFSADEVLPGLNWIYSWDVTEWLSLAGSTQFNRRLSENREPYTRWAQSCAIGYSLTDNWGAYTEWFGLIPHSSDDVKPEHYFNGGFTYLLTDNLQWDIRAGVGMNDAAQDSFFGTGLSIRFR